SRRLRRDVGRFRAGLEVQHATRDDARARTSRPRARRRGLSNRRSLVNTLIAILTGTLVGLHMGTWGMYKDAPHEGFTWPKYFRSAIVASIIGGVTHHFVPWHLAHDAGKRFVFFGLVYCLERAATEF